MIYYLPITILKTFMISIFLILTNPLRCRHYYHELHFTDEKTESQKH